MLTFGESGGRVYSFKFSINCKSFQSNIIFLKRRMGETTSTNNSFKEFCHKEKQRNGAGAGRGTFFKAVLSYMLMKTT